MFREWLNRFAWWLVHKTEDTEVPFIRFQHRKCGSYEVEPTPRMFGWKKPAFQCLKCGCLTDDVECQLVNEPKSHDQKDQMTYPLYA